MQNKSFFRSATICAALLVSIDLFAQTAPHQVLPRSLPDAALSAKPVGRLPQTDRLRLTIGLPLRNEAALQKFLEELYDPRSTNYHHYLTTEQFTERFGPTEKDYRTVRTFAEANHLEVTAEARNRVLLEVSGTVADIERVFHTTLRTYQHPTEARTFYAPDVTPSMNLAVPILSVGGLNNYALARPRLRTVSLAGQLAGANSGAGPGGTYLGSDFPAAYVPDSILTGSGQSVGLLEFDGYTAGDITYYEDLAGLPNVPLDNVLLDDATGRPSGTGGEVEVSLDIEVAVSMAPNLNQVIVYEAPNIGGPFDVILNRMVSDNLASQLSCSWYIPGGGGDPTADGIFQEMAAQGQSFFNASGDDDAYTGLISFPGDNPHITQVGGTTLTTTGPGGARTTETVWNRGGGVGSGGGISTQYSIPDYQTNINMSANQGSTTKRNTPDVAMVADNVYVRADGQDLSVGGTSCAAPLWAGFAALVNEQAAATANPAIGFINPAVDTIGTGPNYISCFFDITTGNNTSPSSPSKFYAVAGYDLCTGWGTPAGQSLINALANPEPLEITPATGFSSLGGVGGPFTLTSQDVSLTNSGTSELTWTLANPVPWLDATPTRGTINPGESPTIVTVSLNANASTLAIGTYTGTLWFTNLNDSNSISRDYSLSIIAPPTITTQPADQAVLEGATASFTVATTGGLPQYYQWQLDGANLSDGGNISGSATSNLFVSDVSSNDAGTYSVVVTNIAGTATSSNASLTITPSAPVIVTQPATRTAIVGETVTLTVTANGTTPYFYQWSYDGTDIDGETNQILTLSNVQLDQSGIYAVQVTNVLGSVNSSNAVLSVYAVPLVTSFSPSLGATGEVVNISGFNFDPIPSDNVVYFGGVTAPVSAANETNLTVTVPAGAIYGPITEIVHGLSASSTASFLPTFPGSSPLSSASLGNGFNIPTGNGPFGIAIGDLDGDGKPDLVVIDDFDANVQIYRNISTNGTLSAASFAPPVILQGATPGGSDNLEDLILADLDGDGRLDIVFEDYNNGVVSVFQNLSSPGSLTTNSFGPRLDFPVGNNPTAVAVIDLDGDGKPEIIAANIGDSTISVLLNVSTNGLLTTSSFAPPVNFDTPSGGPSHVAVGDLDGDGKFDIVTANHSTSTDAVSIFQNTSTPGNISFAPRVDLPAGADQEETVCIGDIDGDGKLDLIIGSAVGANFSVYRNTSSPGTIDTNSFAAPVVFNAGGPIHRGGIVMADMDGDGKPDLAIVDQDSGNLYLYRNLSTPGSFTNGSLAAPVTFPSGNNSATLAIADMNGDGRPDVCIANTFGNNLTLYENTSPLNGPPLISTQPTDQTAVAGTTVQFDIVATGTQPLAYQWFFNGTNALALATNASLTLTNVQDANVGGYSVVITNVLGTATSSVASLTVIDPPVITNEPVSLTIAAGTTAIFKVGVTGTSPAFQWFKNGTAMRDGGNASGTTTATLTLTNVSLSDDANYSVTITNLAGTTNSSVVSLTVLVGPSITTQPLNQTNMAGSTVDFSITATGTPTLYYQWQRNGVGLTDGGNIFGSSTSDLTLTDVSTNDAASYSVLVTNAYGFALSSNAVLTVTPAPTNIPVILSFSPSSGAPGTAVSVNGLNFDPTPGNNTVYFGAVRAVVTAASTTNLIVTEPVGATYAPITETVGGLTAYSTHAFLATFSGSPLSSSSLSNSFNLPAGNGPFGVAIGDLDGDGKPDLVVVDDFDASVQIYRNISTNGTLTAASFAPPVILQGASPIGSDNLQVVILADLDGDGRLDIVFENYDSGVVSVFQNLSSPGSLTTNSFSSRLDFPAGGNLSAVAVCDLDGDGKPDIIAANIGNSTISVFLNISTGGLLTTNSFAAPVSFATPAGGVSHVAVGDLDGDGKFDVVTASHSTSANAVSVFRNTSTIGKISFATRIDLPAGASQEETVAIGDIDGDGKPDLVVGSAAGANFSVYRNTGSPGNIAFAAPVTFSAGGPIHRGGIALGDIDGDGKPDLAIVDQNSGYLFLYPNLSSPGSFTGSSLGTPVTFPSGNNTATVAIGDLDGDGRPDLFMANTYGNNLTLWKNVVPGGAPVITTQPTNQTASAAGSATFTVAAIGILPLSYQWNFNGTNAIAGATNSTLTLSNVQVANAGYYSVTVTNLYGSVTSSNALLTVVVDHFAWSQIPSFEFVNTPFTATIDAQNATNGLFTSFTSFVSINSTNGAGILPSASGNFTNGVWTGTLEISQTVTNLVLDASSGSRTGFSNPFNVVNPPSLTPLNFGTSMLISWPISPSGFVLESSDTLLPGSWTPVPGSPLQFNGQNLQSIPITGTNQFFRLKYSGP